MRSSSPWMTNGGGPHHVQTERKKAASKRTPAKGKKQPRKAKR